jgi:GAF domain-containing protein
MIDFITRILHKRAKNSEGEKSSQNSGFQELPSGIKIDPVQSFIRGNNFFNLSIDEYASRCFTLMAEHKEISGGAFYIISKKGNNSCLRFISGYATPHPDQIQKYFDLGEGFPGQVAENGQVMNISDIPGDLLIESGLGSGKPISLIIFPIISCNKVIAVIELSSFYSFTAEDESFFRNISPSIAEQVSKCESIV